MDPELTEQLNESMRQLSEMVAQLNSTMAGTVRSMNSAATASKNAADTTRQNADRQTNSTNQVVGGQTKLQEAHQQASAKMSEAAQNFGRALDSAKTALASFARAVLSNEEGFKKYGSAVSSAGDGALALGRNFGILGTVAGVAAKALTSLADASLSQSDNLLQTSDTLAKLGAANSFSTDQIYKMAHQVGLTSSQLEKMTGPMKNMGTAFGAMGSGATDATNQFVKMIDVGKGVRNEFLRLGMNDAERIQAQADFISSTRTAGISINALSKQSGGLNKASTDYIRNLHVLADITGQSVEQQQKQQEVAAATLQFQVYANDMNRKILDAKQRGDQAEVDRLAKQLAQAKDAVAIAERTGGKEMAAAQAQYIMQGFSTIGVAQQAMLGTMDDMEKAGRQVNAGMYDSKAAGEQLKNSTEDISSSVSGLGTAISNSPELASTLGLTAERMQAIGELLGKDTAAIGEAAQKRIDANKKDQGAAADDPLQKFRATMVESERQLKQAFDDLVKAISPTINSMLQSAMNGLIKALNFVKDNFDTIITVAKGLAIAAGAAAVALTAIKTMNMISGFKDLLSGKFGQLGSRTNPMHVTMDGMGGGGPAQRAARAAIDDSQLLDKNGRPLRGAAREARAAKLAREAAAATSAPARTGILGKAGGMLGKAGKLIPGVGWLMTAGMAAAEGVGAYNDAENIMGIKGREATTGEKLTAGAAGALSSLTFGLVETKDIAAGLSTTFEFLQKAMGPVIDAGKQVLSFVFWPFIQAGKLIYNNWESIVNVGKSVIETVLSPFIAVGRLVYDNWQSIYNIGKNIVGVGVDIVKIAFYPIIATGKLIARNWDSIVDVGKQVVNVVFWPFIQVGKVVYNNWDKIANLFRTGIGYLDSLWSKIKGFTGWLTGWLYGDDKEEPAKEQPKPEPAKPREQPKPQPKPAETKSDSGGWFSSATNWLFGPDEPKSGSPAPAPSKPAPQADATGEGKRMVDKNHDAAKTQKNAADTSRKTADQESGTAKRNKETTILFNSIVGSFGKIVAAEGSIVASFGKIVVAFKEAIKKFEECVSTLSTAIQNMGTGGSITPTEGSVPQNVRGNLEKIAQGLRKSGFGDENYINAVLGNVMKESGGRFDKQEDIAGYSNTSNARIREIFKSKTRGMSEAELTSLKADPQAFANKMYGDRGGNKQPGDGWLFRGRGPIQLTGRGNYSKASKDIFGDDRLVKNPDLVLDPEVGVQVVAWFLHQNESQMRSKLGLSKTGMLSKQEAALLATSQIAGQAITRGSGYLGTENLSKVESFASAMPTGVGAGGTWGPDTNSELALGKSDGDISALGRDLKKMGIRVSEHPDFGGVQGKHAGRAHYEGRALDLNVVSGRDVDNPRAAAIFDELKPKLMAQGFTTLWRVGGHYDHMHVQKGSDGVKPGTSGVVAARGGVFEGSREGYPATLHGTELVAPLNVESILMKMAKTPADAAPEELVDILTGGTAVEPQQLMERMMNKDSEMIMVLSNKLDKMIDVLENGNDTRQKILKHSKV